MRAFPPGRMQAAVAAWALAAAIFHLYTTSIGLLDSRSQRAAHFLFILPLAFLLYPATKRSPKERPSGVDGLLAVVAVAVNVYLLANRDRLDLRWEGITWPLRMDVLMGTAAVLLCVEAARRAAASALAVVTAGFLAWMLASSHVYTAANASLSARFSRTVEILYLFQGEGMYGNLLGVAATYIAIFVLFGSFVEKTGAATLFTDFARLIVGRTRGSAGKIP